MINAKRQCWAKAHYSRCGVMLWTELVLPLNQMILNLAIGFTMVKKTTTTVKFSKRKLCQQVFWIIDPRKFDFPEGTAIFINENLCFYYKILWSTCKKLWEKKLIHTYFTSNGNIQYRIREKGMFIHLHMLGFKKKNCGYWYKWLINYLLSLLQFVCLFVCLFFDSLCLESPWDLWNHWFHFFCGFAFGNMLFTLL